ncbi:IclR family transcriptional regulator [Pseudonocardia acaciae]|uniref:IclR family transcriptional regulator n=1 Tax=Pseudonocardia acaciae TaxID=551276 RepID=UPI000AB3273F|nr:IclR family transcriptional regulator C-terminal domain-containing protein [Pseudonocardia acaciae]
MIVAVEAGHGRRAGELSSLDRGLQILAYIQDHGQVDAAGIIAGLDIPSSTVYRYVRLLKNAGFVVDVGGQLLPSRRLADPSVAGSEHLVDLARPVLGRLRERSGLGCALTVRVHTAALCLDTRHSGSGSVAYHPGEVLALYAGASATPLLAMAPGPVRRQVLGARLHRFTAATPDAAALRAELVVIREQGYHVSRGWLTPGMTAVGVPVMVAGSCLCALSLIGTDRDLADTAGALELLRHAAGELVARLPKAPSIAWTPPEPGESNGVGT